MILEIDGSKPAEFNALNPAQIDQVLKLNSRSGLSRLVVFDVDSTFIKNEVIDLLAEIHGVGKEVAALTNAAMNGNMDFSSSLRARVSLLSGMDSTAISTVVSRIELSLGCLNLIQKLQHLGHQIALVSGGFKEIITQIAEPLGINHIYANTFEIKNGVLTGNVLGQIIDSAGKARALTSIAQELDIPLADTVAVGDGANDIEMMKISGLSIGFNAKPKVLEVAQIHIHGAFLDNVLLAMGIEN